MAKNYIEMKKSRTKGATDEFKIIRVIPNKKQRILDF